jgi:hypothetical protein
MASAAFPVPGPVNPIRGAIRTSVSTSTDSLVAGQEFSIFVTVQNPFEIPLTLHQISAYLPTEFVDINERQRENRLSVVDDQLAVVEEGARRMGLPATGLLPRKRGFLHRLARILSSVSIFGISFRLRDEYTLSTAVARDVAAPQAELKVKLSLPLIGSIEQVVRRAEGGKDDPDVQASWRERIEQERRELERVRAELSTTPRASTAMQAGNSTTRVFTLRSRQAIWFRPATYRLQIQVEYEIGGLFNVDTIDQVLQVKSSLISMVLGALLGGLAGWFTATGSALAVDATHLISLAVSLVFAMMAVVLFARKKDVQPIIAVEDFWGGVAIGFLVAYSGPKILGGLVSPGPSPVPIVK